MFDFLMPPIKGDDFLRWLIGFLVVLWILWYVFGGRERAGDNINKPYIKPVNSFENLEVYE